MQIIEPHEMAYFTQSGSTPDVHKQFGFHRCKLFDEWETGKIKDSEAVLNLYFTNFDRLDDVRDVFQEFKDELKNLSCENPRSRATRQQ